MRAAIATVVPFYLATALHRPELRWVALGGWLASLADPGGARRPRLRANLAFLASGGVAVALVGMCASTVPTAAIALAAVVFVASLAAAIGAVATNVGTPVAIAATIAAARATDLEDAARFALGAAWAIALSTVAWPIWRHLPVRLALGRVFDRLAAYVDAIDAATEAWPALAREHQRAVRAAIEDARAAALAVRARHTGETAAGSNLRMLVGAGEDAFFGVIALSERAERGGAVPPELAAAFRAIARDLVARRAGPRVELAGDEPLVRKTRAIAEIARDLDRMPPPDDAEPLDAPASWRRELRDAMVVRGPIVQHAVRVAVLAAVALAVGRIATPGHPSWIPVTALAVLQPYLGPTFVRATERVIGTILGAIVALALIAVVHAPVSLALVMFPVAIAAVMTRPRSYRLFVLFVTPIFVILADLEHLDWHANLDRVVDVALGGALALVAAFVGRSHERVRLGAALDDVFDALAAYVRVATPAPRAAVVAARRTLGRALEAAEASLERLLAEPVRDRDGCERAMYVVTYGRRLSTSLTELLESGRTVPADVAGYLEVELARARGRMSTEVPPQVTSPALARLLDRAALLAHTPDHAIS